MLKSLLWATAEKMLNQALYVDNGSLSLRRQLAGKSLSIQLTDLLTLPLLCFSIDRVDLLASQERVADCHVVTTLATLKQLKQQNNLSALIRTGQLTIDGDLAVLQQFVQLTEQAQWDWAEWLSPWLGDLASQQLANGLTRQFTRFTQLFAQQRNMLAHLIEEKQLAPSQQALLSFNRQVTHVAEQAEQVAQRLARLAGQLKG